MAVRGKTSSADLSTENGASEFLSYLVTRFIVVLVVVMVVEQVILLGESLLVTSLEELAGTSSGSTTVDASLLTVVSRLLSILATLVSGNGPQTLGRASAALVSTLSLVLLLLLVLPPFLGALGFARLVVRRVRVLQEQREQELARIDQQRSQFITDVAHDLRTPLMAISGMAHAISDGVVHDDATRDEYLQSICEKADKMSGLVSSVFDYTKLGGGSFSLERQNLELPELLLREAAAVYTDMEDAGMVFSAVVPAIKHNEPGTEIALLLVCRAGIAYVIVADSGAPIPGNPDELFQPFVRGDAARQSSGGSGLGLSICKRIAEMHGYDLMLVQPYGRFTKAFVLQCAVV